MRLDVEKEVEYIKQGMKMQGQALCLPNTSKKIPQKKTRKKHGNWADTGPAPTKIIKEVQETWESYL